MIDPNWVLVTLALSMVGAGRYAYLTIRGKVRPNLVTWSLWAAAPLIGFFAQLDSGVGMPSLQTLGSGLGPLIVFIAALLTRHGRVRVTVFDIWCGVFALIALIAWITAGDARYAVFLAIIADGVAAIPTFRKAWHDPNSESVFLFVLTVLGSVITLLTMTSWAPEVWGFSGYLLLVSLSLTLVILSRRAMLRRGGAGPAA
ncbi:hypothetical protein [Leucobacter sp. GX24907]